MTDKSFGDHMTRNIVKNPLLSTAVTGLSIEDLTHNAVLLPVSLSQEVITRSDQQYGAQTRTLWHTDHSTPNLPSGDSNSNIFLSNQPPNPLAYQQNIKTEKQNEKNNATQSKAPVKTEDDFDVNEYFARLHGTRYVSAPLNLKDDKSLASEDNLEEINLNEDKAQGDNHQSITADIAQNFSQLPTVLPQVASAVFSSFSNMLYKSREQTPDDVKLGCQELPVRSEEAATVALMGFREAAKEVAPPPKEPPVMGTANYRLTTKKKYAQIPGLSTEHTAQTSMYNPISQSNVPSFFVPSNMPDTNQSNDLNIATTMDPQAHFQRESKLDNAMTYTMFNTKDDKSEEVESKPRIATVQDSAVDMFGTGQMSDMNIMTQQTHSFYNQSQYNSSTAAQSTAIIPPPPMFSNLSTKGSQNSAGKSILPPSVARRIGANQPIIKPQAPPSMTSFENIFVPMSVSDVSNEPNLSDVDQVLDTTKFQMPHAKPPSAFTQFSPPSPQSAFTPANVPLSTSTTISVPHVSASITIGSSTSFYTPIEPQPSVPFLNIPQNVQACESATPSIFTPSNVPHHQEIPSIAPNLPPPPTFFNPSAISTDTKEQTIAQAPQFPQSNITQFFNPTGTPTESPKPVPKPPKASGSINFRMTKKRPQYYSGPIEGVGSISNNVKPVMAPVDNNAFQGALFTPTVTEEPVDTIAAPNIEQTILPFDQSTAYAPYELSKPQEPNPQPEYSTAFDLSRETTEYYEPSIEEPPRQGFGIIGSLKSKLSSLDINKIQSSVTTFFDPAFNDTNKGSEGKLENEPHGQQQYQAFGQFEQSSQGGNFEIYVPGAEQATQYQPYAYQIPYNPSAYDQYQQGASQNMHNFYTNQEQRLPTSSYYSPVPQTDLLYNTSTPMANTQVSSSSSVISHSQGLSGNVSAPYQIELIAPIKLEDVPEQYSQGSYSKHDDIDFSTKNVTESTQPVTQNIAQFDTEPKSFFDIPQSSKIDDLKMTDLQVLQESPKISEKLDVKKPAETNVFDIGNQTDFFNLPVGDDDKSTQSKMFSNFSFDPEKKETEIILESQENVGTSDINLGVSASLYGLSSMLADKTKELTTIEDDNNEAPKEIDTIFNRNLNSAFFDYESTEKKPQVENMQDEAASLSIFGREVDISPKDKEADLTLQLIENITSPIQLLNPVEVPLTENNTPVDVVAEISHITEETIETIQVQSATEFLDNIDQFNIGNTRSYGWSTDETPQKASVLKPALQEQDYTLQKTPNPIGFFGGSSLFVDSMTNASDEIKAEFKITHEETPFILPRQMSIPTAPPAGEDSKSDEIGIIDVHSIEQDAKKDYEFYDEFLIEPSETDDDKIEFYEHEKGFDEMYKMESFASRIERFKKMEGTEAFDPPKITPATSTSPSLPIASYFDTGNYAAETHYRKSLGSPSSVKAQALGSPTPQMSIPPGFEEEYQRRLSTLSIENKSCGDRNEIPFIPDTSTQTRPTYSPTFTTAFSKAIAAPGFNVASKMTELVQDVAISAIGSHRSTFEGDSRVKDETEDILSLLPAEIIQPLGLSDILSKGSLKEFNSPEIPSIFSIHQQKLKDEIQDKPLSVTTEIFGLSAPLLENHSLPSISNVFGIKKEQTQLPPEMPSVFVKPAEPSVAKEEINRFQSRAYPPVLPEPINFFSSKIQATEQKPNTDDTSFNRLASYFSAPTKTDQTKSFFELSQGQNHHRHKPNERTEVATTKKHKTLYELSQSQDRNVDSQIIESIPHDKYIANLNLMKDLTSFQSEDFTPEQVVRTVNYFTIEYDDDNLNVNMNRGEPETVKKEIIKDAHRNIETETNDVDDKTANKIIETCKYCCNLNQGHVDPHSNHESVARDYKVRTCMDGKSDNKTKCDKMEKAKENVGKNQSVTVSFENYPGMAEDGNEGVAMMSENRSSTEYTPVKHHWFYRVDVEGKSIWRGFSLSDNKALEEAYLSPDLSETTLVATDGGRYDVNVIGRLRVAVYWAEKPSNVRRCSWFYRGKTDARYVPYTEAVAETLEEEYRHGMTTGEWHRRLPLPNNELVVMHGPAVMVHFLQAGADDAFSAPPLFFGKRVYRNPPKIRMSREQPLKIDHLIMLVHGAGEYRHQKEKSQSTMRPRVVRRGHEESEIEDVEPSNIDHLLLLCHGVGSACDMRFRAVEEVVDDFRATSLQLVQSHYKNSYDNGTVGRVEVLPVSWHSSLHAGEAGVDKRLARVTLDSIPRLRNFTNDTVLDVLFYTSPVYGQTIIDTVCNEMNRIYRVFCERNPAFTGGVSLGGHSLGSVILYDLLCHQAPPPTTGSPDSLRQQVVTGAAGTGQPSVNYPQLDFAPVAMYALGSPIAIFECIRGVESLGADFALPTCKNFFNIFHPYDPIAYRIEPLVNPQLQGVKPSLIPHHKGRKRMHLELKDTMTRVGADIKQKLLESIRTTWTSMWKTQPPPPDHQLEKVVEEELEKEQLTEELKDDSCVADVEVSAAMLGRLNSGRRVDHVLQEAPFEMINEYLFAMSSHVGYWESEDTMLLMLREIYDALGVRPDSTVPQHSLSVQRTRAPRPDETIVVSSSEHPSTSRGGT